VNSDQLPATVNRLSQQHRDDLPKLGEWYWVTNDSDEAAGKRLLCVMHIASNHVLFDAEDEPGVRIRFRDLLSRTTPEPNWKELIQRRIADRQEQLQETLQQLALTYQAAGMADGAEPTLLPSVTRQEPTASKAALVSLRDKEMPAIKESVDRIMQAIAYDAKNLALPMKAQFSRMRGKMEEVEGRIFALELYAGLAEQAKQIADGQPADKDEPIAVRQMMLYMDEEALFDLDSGGMDWRKLDEFDEWVAKPSNRDRILPEQRGIVAMRVRRHNKDYPIPTSIGGFFALLDDTERNMKTYLLLRNGSRLYRLASEVEFTPRLIPLRTEFDKPFVSRSYNWKKSDYDETLVTPDDFEYDEHAGKFKKEVLHYNRVLFLIQGLLDRSEVFSPHPVINMADDAHLERHMRWIRDEEDALPSANPPKWDEYLADLNSTLAVGDEVYCNHSAIDEDTGRPKKDKRGYNVASRPRYCKVTRISRDRKTVRLSWPGGFRWGREHRYPGGGYFGRYGEWPVDRQCHDTVPIESVVNVAAYVPGDYKLFLCDRYLKGEYLEWAGLLFAAEEWHKASAKPTGGWRDNVAALCAKHGVTMTEENDRGQTRHVFTAPAGCVFEETETTGGRQDLRKATRRKRLVLQFRSSGQIVSEMNNWRSVFRHVHEAVEGLKRGNPTTDCVCIASIGNF